MESIKLCQKNLEHINAPVSIPRYHRKGLAPSVVHIGLGNFHRSHQAAYLDELLERGIGKTGIFGINLIPDSFPLGDIMRSQDCLYTLITKSGDGQEKARISGSILGYLNAAKEKRAALERIADRETSLITLTITERGYFYDRKTGMPDTGEAAVRGDLERPGEPSTAAACLASALALRQRAGGGPLTIMSCDNIPSNGKVLKNSVLFFCREYSPGIIPWVEDNVSFPCSMVDRITPATSPALISEMEALYGIADLWPVCCEDFRQWVLEDDFKSPVPPYGEAGVQIVKDAEPYELMKMRLLNGSHSALSYPSWLLGCRMVDEGIAHPLIKAFIRDRYMEEVTPTLPPVPGIDLSLYKDTLISRFSNVNIADTVLRLAGQGTSKIPSFLLKPLSQAVKQGTAHDAFLFALASWARFLEGIDEQGEPIPLEDEDGEAIAEAARKAVHAPAAFLAAAGLKDLSPSQMEKAAGKFKTSLEAIRGKGMKKALEEFLGVNK